MRKKGIWTAIILLGMVLCGCGTSGESEVAVSVEQEDKDSRHSVKETEAMEDAAQAEEESQAAVLMWAEDEYASAVLEDENALYFIGEDHIRKFEKESGEEEFIWESPEGRKADQKWVYDSSKGILVNDRIYFIEEWESQEKEVETTTNHALSVVCTDGTGYERIEKVQMNLNEVLILLDGVLYYEEVRNSYSLNGYEVDQNGKLITEKEVTAKVENIPEGYTLPYYHQNGGRIMTAVESKSRLGYYLLWDQNYHLCKIDSETRKVEKMPDFFDSYSLSGINDKFLLFVSYMDEKMYLYELKTGATRSLGAFNSDCDIIAMDEEYLYLQRTVYGDDFTQHHYEQISLKNGNVTDLFVIDKITGLNIDNPQELMDLTILNGYLYYPGAQDYKLFLMRRAVEMPNAEEVLGSEFYDSRISEIGAVITQKENIYSQNDPERVTGTLDLEWLAVDSHYAGAANINRILEEEQRGNITYERDLAAQYDEWYPDGEENYFSSFYFSSALSPIHYWDGTYLSFVQQNYDYSGGAHGMPYWIGYTFNLQTGEQLGLVDIVSDDEIQIKGLVTQYFTEMYNEDPDMYWDSAVDTVFEYTTLESQFYLSEEGIVFYFGPYELASYADGFQEIVVPYSAWNLKIDLEKSGE